MKAGWHLTKGINHPWPWTNYPSLPTLCPPLRGELCNNSATWKLSASQGWALMDAPARLCLLRSPGRLTFKSLSLSDSTPTKQAIVRDKGPWPLEMKWRCRGRWEGSPAGNGWSKVVGEQESVETLEVTLNFCSLCLVTLAERANFYQCLSVHTTKELT